ncbi:MAG: zinc-dependent peptidase [Pseudomonadales bacterium]|nr:zinc-dependent peptidase [Pseudomonadales bacterium]
MQWVKKLSTWLGLGAGVPVQPFSHAWVQYLEKSVSFYRLLADDDKRLFEQRIQLFWETTEVVGYGVEVTDEDRLLVAASAIIPVWSFPDWHYFNLSRVILLPGAFNPEFRIGEADSSMLGMVGTGPMQNKMVLSKTALHAGFANDRDKRNVGIHEFAHLIDMADGDTDGFPERLKEYAFSIPWFELAHSKIKAINNRKSNIDPYGATDKLEFFAVATEYFFERPKMLHRKHPQLYQALESFYQQDRAAIAGDVVPRKNSPCPCGSGKKYKRCCMPRN